MKKFLALILFFAMVIPAFAFDINIHACTSDNHSADLTIDIVEGTPKEVAVDISDVFIKVAKSLTADQLVDSEGFQAFVSNLSDEDLDAIESFQGPPIIGDVCE